MIDPPELRAATAMFKALNNLPCGCTHNVPYEGSQVERKIVNMCPRCKSMMLWNAVKPKDQVNEQHTPPA